MPKRWLSGPQRCLLKKWADASALENTMKQVRESYKGILQKVLDKVQGKHEKLDCNEIHPNWNGLNLAVGKSAWRCNKGQCITGLWLACIRIENLVFEDEGAPYAMVLISHPRKAIDLQAAERKLLAAAKRILTKEDIRGLDSGVSSGEATVSYYLRVPRRRLLDYLDGDGSKFVSYMAAHFESMMEFVPVLDAIFDGHKRAGG